MSGKTPDILDTMRKAGDAYFGRHWRNAPVMLVDRMTALELLVAAGRPAKLPRNGVTLFGRTMRVDPGAQGRKLEMTSFESMKTNQGETE